MGISVTKKLLAITTTLVVVALVVVGGIAWQMRRAMASAEARQAAFDQRVKGTLSLITKMDKVVSAYQEIAASRDPDRLEALLAQVEKDVQQARAHVARSAKEAPEVGRQLSTLVDAGEKVKEHVLHGDYAPAQLTMLEQCNPAFAALLSAVTSAEEAIQARDSAAARQQASTEQTRSWVLIGLGVSVLLVLTTVALMVLRRIHFQLTSAVGEMTSASTQMKSAASQVSSSSQQSAAGASKQAAALQETTSMSEQLKQTTQKNVDSAQAVSELMGATSEVVKEANERLDTLVTSMDEINQSSTKIAKIIKVIDDIAFQTNILALNAAVEAARAGEMGQGFAVVADEVRSLAQRCAQAAEDTTNLIRESAARSKEGGARLDEVAAVISRITQQATKARELAGQVNSASQQQAGGIRQMAASLSEMLQVTEQTAANSEESAAAAEEMEAQSESMQTTVVRLKELVGAGG